MTNMQTDYDVKLCLQRLRGRGGFLPKGALRSVMENWSLMVEPMRAELELLAQNPEESRKHSGNLSLYALYLVAYFKEKSCVESLCKILLHDGEWLDAWLDTTVEEDLCRIMAALLDAKQLRVLVDSRDVWWLGRATALEAMFILVMRGEYDREA
ncbi:MAG: DUF1186 domain-containing protein, partial [Chlamydiia bacterium]|nr:DUF1186 domain-containing protein [Chlamydiia bacterium]